MHEDENTQTEPQDQTTQVVAGSRGHALGLLYEQDRPTARRYMKPVPWQAAVYTRIASAYRSYSSESVTLTLIRSPGRTFRALLTNTFPSISGASALERPTAPSSSTSSISTSISRPTLFCRRSREMAC